MSAASPGPDGVLEPGWSAGRPDTAGPAYQRYVPDLGVLRVTAQPGHAWAWQLTYSSTVPLGDLHDGFPSAAAAMRAAGSAAAASPPGLLDSLTAGQARRLYLMLSRTGAAAEAGDAYRRFMVASLDHRRRGPDPLAVAEEARLWRQSAQETGVSERHFDIDALPGDGAARAHLQAAAANWARGLRTEAVSSLRAAFRAVPEGSAAQNQLAGIAWQLHKAGAAAAPPGGVSALPAAARLPARPPARTSAARSRP